MQVGIGDSQIWQRHLLPLSRTGFHCVDKVTLPGSQQSLG
jgi:hypothetical protein